MVNGNLSSERQNACPTHCRRHIFKLIAKGVARRANLSVTNAHIHTAVAHLKCSWHLAGTSGKSARFAWGTADCPICHNRWRTVSLRFTSPPPMCTLHLLAAFRAGSMCDLGSVGRGGRGGHPGSSNLLSCCRLVGRIRIVYAFG